MLPLDAITQPEATRVVRKHAVHDLYYQPRHLWTMSAILSDCLLAERLKGAKAGGIISEPPTPL